MTDVRHVRWEEFPEELHLAILQEIKLGDYITSLPYKIPNGYLTWKIPIIPLEPTTESMSKIPMVTYLRTQAMEYPYMEFQRILVEWNEEQYIVWQKLK